MVITFISLLITGLLNIIKNYPKYVISTDKFDFSQEEIIHQNLIDFLLNRLKQSEIISY